MLLVNPAHGNNATLYKNSTSTSSATSRRRAPDPHANVMR
jgi:hypothetical protein